MIRSKDIENRCPDCNGHGWILDDDGDAETGPMPTDVHRCPTCTKTTLTITVDLSHAVFEDLHVDKLREVLLSMLSRLDDDADLETTGAVTDADGVAVGRWEITEGGAA